MRERIRGGLHCCFLPAGIRECELRSHAALCAFPNAKGACAHSEKKSDGGSAQQLRITLARTTILA